MTRRTELVITQQGAVRVNEATIFAESERIACVSIDLHSRYAKIGCSIRDHEGTHALSLHADEGTMNIDESCDREAQTVVTFKEFVGWTMFAVESPARYTLRVVFVKEED